MKQDEIKKVASKIWSLEQECQADKNTSENLKEIENIANNLSLADLFEIMLEIEKKHNKLIF